MQRVARVVTLLFALALTGCALDKRPVDHAEYFFKRGRDNIVAALKHAEATPAQMQAAERILERDRAALIAAIGNLLQGQRSVFAGVATGAESGELMPLEAAFHATHSDALRIVGGMHAALRAAVGDAVWTKARTHMRERLADIYKE